MTLTLETAAHSSLLVQAVPLLTVITNTNHLGNVHKQDVCMLLCQ